jgi:4-diphosphocytidyl-2-C-methyl-D-erythritol kinase
MVIFPKAKINIGLRITEKRSDGYHNLETIFYPVCLCDAIEFVIPIEKSDHDIIEVTGNYTETDPENNLVIKAIKMLRTVSDFPFLKIHLHKAIPAGAGLGGGSSDASTILKALNRFFGMNLESSKLKELSLNLGSDCPFFIDCVPSYAEGRGELMKPVKSLPHGLYIVLLNPEIHISTKEAYSSCKPARPVTSLEDLYKQDISEWKNTIVNDFEEYVFRKHPLISFIKESLYETGASYSSMSGSGSTVFGIFQEAPVLPKSLNKYVIYSGLLY